MQGGGDDGNVFGVHAALQLRGEEDVGGFADGVAGGLVADTGVMGWGGRDTRVMEVGGEREGEVRHHDCVAGGGELKGMVVSGGLMRGAEFCTVTTRTSEPFSLAVAFRIGNSLTVNRKWPT